MSNLYSEGTTVAEGYYMFTFPEGLEKSCWFVWCKSLDRESYKLVGFVPAAEEERTNPPPALQLLEKARQLKVAGS
ncbi:MAG: hypothetical protein IJ228_11815 [Succinivibrio sp.]|nr:hypothetical protein [Succinivibrio sp.]